MAAPECCCRRASLAWEADRHQIFDASAESQPERGTAILRVEQNAHHALRLAHRGAMCWHRWVVMQGQAAELAENKDIRRLSGRPAV